MSAHVPQAVHLHQQRQARLATAVDNRIDDFARLLIEEKLDACLTPQYAAYLQGQGDRPDAEKRFLIDPVMQQHHRDPQFGLGEGVANLIFNVDNIVLPKANKHDPDPQPIVGAYRNLDKLTGKQKNVFRFLDLLNIFRFNMVYQLPPANEYIWNANAFINYRDIAQRLGAFTDEISLIFSEGVAFGKHSSVEVMGIPEINTETYDAMIKFYDLVVEIYSYEDQDLSDKQLKLLGLMGYRALDLPNAPLGNGPEIFRRKIIQSNLYSMLSIHSRLTAASYRVEVPEPLKKLWDINSFPLFEVPRLAEAQKLAQDFPDITFMQLAKALESTNNAVDPDETHTDLLAAHAKLKQALSNFDRDSAVAEFLAIRGKIVRLIKDKPLRHLHVHPKVMADGKQDATYYLDHAVQVEDSKDQAMLWASPGDMPLESSAQFVTVDFAADEKQIVVKGNKLPDHAPQVLQASTEKATKMLTKVEAFVLSELMDSIEQVRARQRILDDLCEPVPSEQYILIQIYLQETAKNKSLLQDRLARLQALQKHYSADPGFKWPDDQVQPPKFATTDAGNAEKEKYQHKIVADIAECVRLIAILDNPPEMSVNVLHSAREAIAVSMQTLQQRQVEFNSARAALGTQVEDAEKEAAQKVLAAGDYKGEAEQLSADITYLVSFFDKLNVDPKKQPKIKDLYKDTPKDQSYNRFVNAMGWSDQTDINTWHPKKDENRNRIVDKRTVLCRLIHARLEQLRAIQNANQTLSAAQQALKEHQEQYPNPVLKTEAGKTIEELQVSHVELGQTIASLIAADTQAQKVQAGLAIQRTQSDLLARCDALSTEYVNSASIAALDQACARILDEVKPYQEAQALQHLTEEHQLSVVETSGQVVGKIVAIRTLFAKKMADYFTTQLTQASQDVSNTIRAMYPTFCVNIPKATSDEMITVAQQRSFAQAREKTLEAVQLLKNVLSNLVVAYEPLSKFERWFGDKTAGRFDFFDSLFNKRYRREQLLQTMTQTLHGKIMTQAEVAFEIPINLAYLKTPVLVAQVAAINIALVDAVKPPALAIALGDAGASFDQEQPQDGRSFAPTTEAEDRDSPSPTHSSASFYSQPSPRDDGEADDKDDKQNDVESDSDTSEESRRLHD